MPFDELAYDLITATQRPSVLADVWIMILTPICLLHRTRPEETTTTPAQSPPTHDHSGDRVATGS